MDYSSSSKGKEKKVEMVKNFLKSTVDYVLDQDNLFTVLISLGKEMNRIRLLMNEDKILKIEPDLVKKEIDSILEEARKELFHKIDELKEMQIKNENKENENG